MSRPIHELAAGYLKAGGLWPDVGAQELDHTLAQIVGRVPELSTLPVDAAHVSWAMVGDGIALPHVRVAGELPESAGVLSILWLRDAAAQAPAPPDGAPLRYLLFFIAPSSRLHLQLVGHLSGHLLRGRLADHLRVRSGESIAADLAQPAPPPPARAR